MTTFDSTEHFSPDGFIHLDDCEIYPVSQGRACTCGAAQTNPDESVVREAIQLPADGVIRTVLLDGVSLDVSVRVIPPVEVPPRG